MTKMTTAELRQMASDAARRCDWATAADLWDQAITNYPGTGAMADHDKANLTRKRDAARGMMAQAA